MKRKRREEDEAAEAKKEQDDFVAARTERKTVWSRCSTSPGAKRAVGFLHDEIDVNLAQLGCPRFDDLGPEYLLWDDSESWQRNTPHTRA